ncbi:MAG TPA: hypothetical protein VGG25_04870 [Streptosporangiaceae bacterium]
MTLGVHPPLQRAVAATLSAGNLVLVEAVVAELEGLAKTAGDVAGWAGATLGQLDWLGTPVRLDDPAGTRLAVELQEMIAGGRPLLHDMQHFGEAAIISLASRARTLRPLMLSDDYDARVAARNHNVEPFSVHKLLHLMIRQGKVTAVQAASYADTLHSVGRAQDYTAAELHSGRLGRVGQP